MARLVRAEPGKDPGFRRVRAGRSFRYLDPSGKTAGSRARRRIRDLVIPPAWDDVWIAAEPLAHIQAVGVDAAGRRQYLYHHEWRRRRDRNKYSRALTLAEALPHARARVTTALRTAPVARASYVDRRVFTEYRKGRILDLSVSAETAIIRLLGGTAAPARNGN